ncbi:hypothetical protein [Nodularia sphaerocarpa]|uniref:hypothetical protein n=1 Tax=Nodularia sphaerocarpa TaxID=137816 RepID=UPI001EFA4EBE|nr:hypothetical protein [Nodularia sphaerocarpa]MDB9375639.1 hypothetical protein [Nodularia sphaerocarpa CS-585]MDB9376404.1 hypothetical protein [Nodularia sphaerocarpa CS-585A2]ULP74030.1 hypothetical protein BDGGKGIB_03690 [Nodularia sphaerocarpa UHCC 0038]
MLRRSLCVSALILAGAVGFASSAQAQTADVPFAGFVGTGCTLLPTPGVLIPNAGDTALSSSEGTGATSGTVIINCSGNAAVTVAEPVIVTVPAGADGAVLASTLTVGSDSISGLVNDTLALVFPGLPVVADVDMTATLAGGLPTGAYSYIVTVTATAQ